MKNDKRSWAQRLALASAFALMGSKAMAATDITGVITEVNGYYTAGVAVGIAVLLFVLGRSVVRKVAR